MKEFLIAAHRGVCGGNIVQNTIEAYENALLQGADIIEADVAMTADGVFYMFHNGQEKHLLGVEKSITDMNSVEVEGLHLRNVWGMDTGKGPDRLDDVLEHFKGRCLINIDRSWFYGKAIFDLLDRHQMSDQIILKNYGTRDDLELLREYGKGILYMPILECDEDWRRIRECGADYYGLEVIFQTEESEFASKDFIENLHGKGKKIWVNALTLDDKTLLCAGHDDNCAVMRSMDDSWGWLIRNGYDIIQTDWPFLLKAYDDNMKKSRCGEGNAHAGNLCL